MTDFWAPLGAAEDAVTFASGLAAAGYFLARAARARRNRARRLAAFVLASLCGGAALHAGIHLRASSAEGWPDVLARLPSMLGAALTSGLIAMGGRR